MRFRALIFAALLGIAFVLGFTLRRDTRAPQVSEKERGVRLVPTEEARAAPAPPAEVQEDAAAKELSDDPGHILPPHLELVRGELPWERQIDAVLTSSALSESAKAQRLFAILPSLPEEALDRAARQAIERLSDRDYSVASRRLTDPATHGQVSSVLFEDLLQRPDAVALPTLLRVARAADHPFTEPARENLELLLGKNFGTDWAAWEAEIRRALSDPAQSLP